MDTLANFTTDQLRVALARAWSTAAAEEIKAELASRETVTPFDTVVPGMPPALVLRAS